jgi:hypothetical protein
MKSIIDRALSSSFKFEVSEEAKLISAQEKKLSKLL